MSMIVDNTMSTIAREKDIVKKRILDEIESFERKQAENGLSKPGKYYFKGNQVYPRESVETIEYKKDNVPLKLVKTDGKHDETITRQIIEDMVLLRKLGHLD